MFNHVQSVFPQIPCENFDGQSMLNPIIAWQIERAQVNDNVTDAPTEDTPDGPEEPTVLPEEELETTKGN